MDRRERLLEGIDQASEVCAEIGALSHPLLDPSVPGVRFIDYTDTESLRQKYADDAYASQGEMVEVSAIWGDNTLLEALGTPVDHIVASHVIEHVPDLVTWLAELHESLRPGGSVRLAIPDRRFTFDYLRQESRLSDVIQAHMVRARRPQPQAILDFHLNVVDLDCGAAWDGRIEPSLLHHYNTPAEAIEAAQDAINGNYRDVHCWVFTPRSFALMMIEMAQAGRLEFACASFQDTEKYTFEFFVALEPSDDIDAIVNSWKLMEDSVNKAIPAEELLKAANKTISDQDVIIRELREKLIATERGRDVMIDDIREIMSSKSWRLTAPLRAVVRSFQK